MIRILIKGGADCSLKDKWGNRALDYALDLDFRAAADELEALTPLERKPRPGEETGEVDDF